MDVTSVACRKRKPLKDWTDYRQRRNQAFSGKSGFSVGEVITVVSDMNGSLIVKVKDSRIALGKDVTGHILVSKE